jgi:serine/threonine-protein kinase
LIDFGLAKISDCNASSYTGHFGIVGTPAYMAPEHLRGEELDARADLYALGVILYQLLCGALPFYGKGYLEIGEKILSQEPEDVRRRTEKEIPWGLARLAMQALAKDRNDRPSTAREFARRLRSSLELETAPARLARAVFARLQSLQQGIKNSAQPLVQSLKRSA